VAFQQVEDNLSALHSLADEADSQQRATTAADLSLRLTTNRFNAGAVSYLDVVTAQTIALTNQRTADQIAARQMEASVLLLKALGGTWPAQGGSAAKQPDASPLRTAATPAALSPASTAAKPAGTQE
jgi:outer membrane protein TolC